MQETKLVSVIMSARNEFPNIVHTVHSILSDLESFLDPSQFEILIVDNCSDDREEPHRGVSGTTDFVRARGMFNSGVVRILYDPIAGNVSARNKGVLEAKGKYIFFSDAHMAFTPGFHQRMIQTCEETGGIVHPAYSWMGAYPPQPSCQYSWKLGEISPKGTWNNYFVAQDDWFYIPASGHCSLVVRRDQFLEFGGYPDYLRCYGGGEVYLDSVWWMLGSNTVSEPRAHCYHLSAARGYSYHNDDFIHNLFHSAFLMGADDWAERTYLNYLRKGRKEVLDELWNQAKAEAVEKRSLIQSKEVYTLNEVLADRPWDKRNDMKFGRHFSGMLVYHDSWLEEIKGTEVEKLYLASPTQAKLAEFIENNLSEFIYKRTK